MSATRWERVKTVFGNAIEIDRGSRERYVRDASEGDEELFAEIMSLLAADSERTVLRNPVALAIDGVLSAPGEFPPSVDPVTLPLTPAADREPEADDGVVGNQPVEAPSSRFFLTFESPLEEEYATEYFRRSLPRVRAGTLLGAFIYAAFGILDAWIAPGQVSTLWLIRFCFVVPCGLGFFAFSFAAGFSQTWQEALFVIVFIASAGIVVMIGLIPPPGSYLYSTGLLILTIFYCTLMRLGFLYAVALSLAISALYNVVALYTHMSLVAVVTNDAMLISGDVIALSANLTLERYNRRQFLQTREIAARTAALEMKNTQLIATNAELQRSREEILRSSQRNEMLFLALTEALPGTVLDGKYRLEEKIGAGGFGTVYRGLHLLLHRPVAVKLLKPSGDDLLTNMERFRQEGAAACHLVHANAVNVLDFGVSAGAVAYLVMELLEGRSLQQELEERGRLPLPRCCEIVKPLCDVLTEAHRRGMVHRDLKPSNVFLHRTQSSEIVKIIDFGLAKILEPGAAALGTSMDRSIVGGTPGYIAPERFTHGTCNDRADVYSLGVMVYEMLCGDRPDEGDVIQPNRFLCGDLAALLNRALASSPIQRPTVEEFGRLFADAADGADCGALTAAEGAEPV